MSQQKDTLKSLVDRWRAGPQLPLPAPEAAQALEPWLGSQPVTINATASNSQRDEFEFNHYFAQATKLPHRSRLATAEHGWHGQDVLRGATSTGSAPRRVEKSKGLSPEQLNPRKYSHAEGFFDAFCTAAPAQPLIPTPPRESYKLPSGLTRPSVVTPSSSLPVLPARVPNEHCGDITDLLEGPRPSGFTDTSVDDERRMSSLMDAAPSEFQPVTAAGNQEPEQRAEPQHKLASRHLAIPTSQHSATVGAMVRMLTLSNEKWEQKMDGLREDTDSLAINVLSESEVREGGSVSAIKWRMFDVILKVTQSGPATSLAMGLVHLPCEVVAHRPKIPKGSSSVNSPIAAIASACRAPKRVLFTLLMPASQYNTLSIDCHPYVGLAMPYSATLIPEAAQMVILPSFNILPLPLQTTIHSSAPSNALPEPFRFYGNPLAAKDSSRSPSKGPAAAEHQMDSASGYCLGPYPIDSGVGVDEEGWRTHEGDWHVPIETLDALMAAYATQQSYNY